MLILFMFCRAWPQIFTAARAKLTSQPLVPRGPYGRHQLPGLLIVGGVTRLIPLTGVTPAFYEPGRLAAGEFYHRRKFLLRAGDEATGREAELTGHRHHGRHHR